MAHIPVGNLFIFNMLAFSSLLECPAYIRNYFNAEFYVCIPFMPFIFSVIIYYTNIDF
jgi:hypothetical protein